MSFFFLKFVLWSDTIIYFYPNLLSLIADEDYSMHVAA